MTRYFTLLLLFFSIAATAQYDSEEVTFLSNWDDDSLNEHFFGTFNEVWGYTADDREYAIFGSSEHIHIFDVTTPTDLVEVVKIPMGNNSSWRDFKTFSTYAYAVADGANEGMNIIDLSQLPDTAVVVNNLSNEFQRCHNIYIDVDNARLYTAGARGSAGSEGSYVYDLLQDPSQPTLLEKMDLNTIYFHDVYVRDNIFYGSGGNDGYFIWDLNDLENPSLMASLETNGYNHSSWVSDDGGFAFFAEEVPRGLPLGIMDLCDMENGNIEVNNYFKFPLIEDLAPADDLVTPHNPFIIGDFVYVSYYRDGLHVYDISNPAEPTRVGYFDCHPQNSDYIGGYQGTWGCYPFLPSGNILVSDMDNGLFVVDFTMDETGEPGVGTLCAPSSNKSPETIGFSLAPNPSKGFIQIELPAEINDYTMAAYDITGKLSWSEKGKYLKKSELDLSGLASGIYLLEVRTKNALYREKVIIE